MTHIKHLVILAVVLCITASCSNDTVQDTNNSPSLWQYDGQRNVINTLIAKLEHTPEGKRLETNLGKRTLLWDATKAFRIEGKKRLLVPITNTKHSKIMGVVVFTQRNGKIHHDCINRRSIFGKGNFKAPFWRKGIWFGYITTLEDVYINKSGKTKGFWKKGVPNSKNTKSARTYHCDYYEVEECWVNVLYEDETLDNVVAIDVIHCDIYIDEKCYFVEDEDDDEDPVGDIGDSPGGGGGGGPSTPSLPVDDRIDSSQLDGKALCVYEKMESLGLVKKVLSKFDGENSIADLTLKSDDIGLNDRAVTSWTPGDREITITINNSLNSFKSADDNPNIIVANTIIHEIIHAEFARQIIHLIGNDKLYGLAEDEIFELLNNGETTAIYEYYRETKDWSHNFMADFYRDTFARVTQEFDTGIAVPVDQTPEQLYLDVAWLGLMNFPDDDEPKIIAFDNLSTREKNRIISELNNLMNTKHNETCE